VKQGEASADIGKLSCSRKQRKKLHYSLGKICPGFLGRLLYATGGWLASKKVEGRIIEGIEEMSLKTCEGLTTSFKEEERKSISGQVKKKGTGPF